MVVWCNCALPCHCAQTLHSWASEELSGRCSAAAAAAAAAAALLSTEDNQEEQCKQVERSDQSQHRRHAKPCLLDGPYPAASRLLTHLKLILNRFCCDITKVGGAALQKSPRPLKCLLLLVCGLDC